MLTCCDILLAEHRETERLLEHLNGVLTELPEIPLHALPERLAEASQFYHRLATDLLRHFVLEEKALFAVLSAYRTMMLMEVEHDDLLTLQNAFVAALTRSVQRGKPEPELSPAFLAFQERLKAHIREEEAGVFPLAESTLEPEEKQKVLRLFAEIQAGFITDEPLRERPKPEFQIFGLASSVGFERPLAYHTLLEREHTSVQQVKIRAGHRQSPHWAGPHQLVLVLSGEVLLWVEEIAHPVAPGMLLMLDSRLVFAFEAKQDTELLLFRIWPHPHYTKAL
jgi:hemerythrin-like domain-containing protein/quercetin dioxygenase-like cupin family protein